MTPPNTPFQPYLSRHEVTTGPGDARPTGLEIVKDCEAIGDLHGKTVLITGCSSGIGAETARALYATGMKLFLTARDMAKLSAVIDDIVATSDVKDTPRPEGIEMRLESLESVKRGAETFMGLSGGKLNIL
jgi:NAD(P)-dependent dehydrogenase (short-subunit alcohol dehydrogenase family)